MRILVCVKQVPDRESDFRIRADGTGYEENGLVFRMNEFDLHALEEAIRIREVLAGVTVTALSVGPPRAESVIRRSLEMGADHGVHILTPERTALDGLETASLISACARRQPFDLLLFGVMSEDLQRSQTGPMAAALLDLPCATNIVRESLSEDGSRATVARELEGGCRETLEIPLPCVLTVQTGINLPRYPSLSNKLRARRQPLEVLRLEELPQPEKCRDFVRLCEPAPLPAGTLLTGTLEEQAEKLTRVFYERGLLR